MNTAPDRNKSHETKPQGPSIEAAPATGVTSNPPSVMPSASGQVDAIERAQPYAREGMGARAFFIGTGQFRGPRESDERQDTVLAQMNGADQGSHETSLFVEEASGFLAATAHLIERRGYTSPSCNSDIPVSPIFSEAHGNRRAVTESSCTSDSSSNDRAIDGRSGYFNSLMDVAPHPFAASEDASLDTAPGNG